MAIKSKCKIVPITFYENYDAIKNKKIKAKISPAVTADVYENMSTSELSEYVKDIIYKNLKEGFDEANAKIVEVK